MKTVIAERGEFYERSVKSSGKLVAKQFDMYMQKKGFSGTGPLSLSLSLPLVSLSLSVSHLTLLSVQFDHKEHLLRITTQTDNLDENTQCNDMRQMSGGERSYTTLCLLLALGHVIECPFRLMDEYDVFLDEISREITLKTIQQYALDKEQKGRQFIILTPHNVTGVVTTDEVRVKRMPAPQRRSAIGPNQTTLD
jgi:chromosome segregation ATPase